MWMDQLSIMIGETSILITYTSSCVLFLPLSENLSDIIEGIAVWTVLGAISADAILSVLTTIYTVVRICKEYSVQVSLVKKNLSKVKPTFRDDDTAVRVILA